MPAHLRTRLHMTVLPQPGVVPPKPNQTTEPHKVICTFAMVSEVRESGSRSMVRMFAEFGHDQEAGRLDKYGGGATMRDKNLEDPRDSSASSNLMPRTTSQTSLLVGADRLGLFQGEAALPCAMLLPNFQGAMAAWIGANWDQDGPKRDSQHSTCQAMACKNIRDLGPFLGCERNHLQRRNKDACRRILHKVCNLFESHQGTAFPAAEPFSSPLHHPET